MSKPRVAFVYAQGRIERLPLVERGEAPSEFFYGAIEMARAGWTVGHFEFAPRSVSPLRAQILDLPRRLGIGPAKTDGHSLMQAFALCETLKGFDCVVATAGKIAFALGLCAAAGRLRRPIVGIQVALLHYPHGGLRRAITDRLLNRMDTVLFGDGELQPMIEYFGIESARIRVSQFGVDPEFWHPAEGREFVLSIGNDARRDYATLLAGAPQIPLPIHIVTSHQLPEPLPPNVVWHRGSWHDRALSDVELRALYQRAACVVVPLHDSVQPSGQSVTLQAMACGKPVILTRTRGLWSREMMEDGRNVVFVPPADPAQLAEKINAVLASPERAQMLALNARQTAMGEGNIAHFARGITAACEAAIARTSVEHPG